MPLGPGGEGILAGIWPSGVCAWAGEGAEGSMEQLEGAPETPPSSLSYSQQQIIHGRGHYCRVPLCKSVFLGRDKPIAM